MQNKAKMGEIAGGLSEARQSGKRDKAGRRHGQDAGLQPVLAQEAFFYLASFSWLP